MGVLSTLSRLVLVVSDVYVVVLHAIDAMGAVHVLEDIDSADLTSRFHIVLQVVADDHK